MLEMSDRMRFMLDVIGSAQGCTRPALFNAVTCANVRLARCRTVQVPQNVR